MPRVVDTCLLIDITDADPAFAAGSAALLDDQRTGGLVISPVTYAEMAPVFDGDASRQDELGRLLQEVEELGFSCFHVVVLRVLRRFGWRGADPHHSAQLPGPDPGWRVWHRGDGLVPPARHR